MALSEQRQLGYIHCLHRVDSPATQKIRRLRPFLPMEIRVPLISTPVCMTGEIEAYLGTGQLPAGLKYLAKEADLLSRSRGLLQAFLQSTDPASWRIDRTNPISPFGSTTLIGKALPSEVAAAVMFKFARLDMSWVPEQQSTPDPNVACFFSNHSALEIQLENWQSVLERGWTYYPRSRYFIDIRDVTTNTGVDLGRVASWSGIPGAGDDLNDPRNKALNDWLRRTMGRAFLYSSGN